LVKNSPIVKIEGRNDRIFVKSGKTKGDIPSSVEDIPRMPKIDDGTSLSAADVGWLCTHLPSVSIPDLDKTGLLCALCDGREWRISCSDDIHGACAYGEGASKIKFSLMPADAEVFRAILDLAGENGQVVVGYASSLLLVRSGTYFAAIPTVETPQGFPQKLSDIESGTKAVAKFVAADLRDSLSALGPVATAKDATPLTIKLKETGIKLSVTSPAGSVESEIAAKASGELEFRVSFALLSSLVARASDTVVLRARLEKADVTRITLNCGNLHLVMLTSS
jgi:hypothetical protein